MTEDTQRDDGGEREAVHRRGIENLPPEYQELAREGQNREWVTITTYTASGSRFRVQIRQENAENAENAGNGPD